MKINIRRTDLRQLIKYTASKKGIKRILITLAAAAAAVVILLLFLSKNAGNGGDFIPESNGEAVYPSLFYHYTGFNEDPYCSIRLSWKKTSVRLEGETASAKLNVSIFPITLDDKRIEYVSSDESIAKIDENGTITAYKPGNVRISATLLKSGQTETAELEVVRPVTGIMIADSSITMNMSDSFRKMSAEVYPKDATNKNVTWVSKNPKVASVDENGTLHPAGVGITELTAVTADGGFTAKCFVNVVNKVINVDSVTIQNKGSGKLATGESMNLIVTVLPQNAKNKTITWTSSDERIITVSKTGRIKAVAEGKATITAKASNGKTDSVELTIEKGTGESALDLYGKKTSENEIPRDILGNTYVTDGTASSSANGQIAYTSYNISLDDIVTKQMGLSPPPKIWRDGGPVYATRDETKEYMDPANYCTGTYKYQFLDLSHSNGVSADALNRFLDGKGILSGMGQAFVDAAEASGVSEVYLVAHACLETGNGSTTLANGVSVNGTTVYNMFGIGAYDDSAVYSGSQRAYSLGWTSPETAIKGGAAWISQYYINAGEAKQNTLYKMLWNPENPGVHQYATDIGWAVKQAVNIEKIFNEFPEAVLSYDIPVYQGETAASIE
ncbi:MAG: Ig-like domain-containing protein [Clostridia bacterium]|nr:Ig-like domain-containing protein [Clostridia bacterium]